MKSQLPRKTLTHLVKFDRVENEISNYSQKNATLLMLHTKFEGVLLILLYSGLSVNQRNLEKGFGAKPHLFITNLKYYYTNQQLNVTYSICTANYQVEAPVGLKEFSGITNRHILHCYALLSDESVKSTNQRRF